MKNNLTSVAFSHDAHWAIWEPSGRVLWEQLKTTDMVSHKAEYQARRSDMPEVEPDEPTSQDRPYVMSNGIAIISICGPMTKAQTSWDTGCSTVEIRKQVRQAANDPSVTGILLRIDSPGGSVSGTQALADDVAAAVKKKPVYAYIEDLGCSAAYWVASQCEKMFCNETAIVGSIGTYMVIYDMSKMYADAGVDVLLFSTGDYKGSGTPGTVITDEQKTAFQSTVDSLNDHFISGVSRGRSMARKRVEQLADGNVHVGSEALSLGLVDGVDSMDNVLARMSQPKIGRPKQRASQAAHALDYSMLATVKVTPDGKVNITAFDELNKDQGPRPDDSIVYHGDAHGALSDNDLAHVDFPHAGTSLEQSLQTALAAVGEGIERARKVNSMRNAQGRTISPTRLNQLRLLQSELTSLIGVCSTLPTVEEDEADTSLASADTTPAKPRNAESDRAFLDAQMVFALSQAS